MEIFKKYTEKQMDDVTHLLDRYLISFNDAIEALDSSSKGSKLQNCYEILTEIESIILKQDREEVASFILKAVFECNNCSIDRIFNSFNMVNILFKEQTNV